MLLFRFSLLLLVIASPLVADEYKLVWSQEFNCDQLDDTWSYFIGALGWNNNLQYFRKENARVDNGKLKITAKKENYRGSFYTSGAIRSIEMGDWLYGKIEIRAKVPSVNGLLPAIWLKPTDSDYGSDNFKSGEIDILEHVGFEREFYRSTLHTFSRNLDKLNAPGVKSYIDNISEEFHTYLIVWKQDQIEFFLDGNSYFTYKKSTNSYKDWPFDKRFHLILSLAVGGDWAGSQGIELNNPVDFEIDWVRVYQTQDQIELNRSIYGKAFKGKGELLLNSTFYSGKSSWSLYSSNGADAILHSTEEELEVDIKKNSSKPWNIELSQKGIILERGGRYKLEFIAKSSDYKNIYCGIGIAEEPYTHYTGQEFYIGDEFAPYFLEFDCKESQENSRIIFNLGKDTKGITFQKISLKRIY